MKRNLVALAVAGAFLAPAAAMADGSGIVLTGLVHGDVGFGQQKRDGGASVYKRQANIGTFATRWEIDGTEDLGWAKAIFGLAMDQQFAGSGSNAGLPRNNNNIGDLNNRNSFLGLTGGFGTIKIGQNEHLYEIQQIVQDPDPASESTFSTLTLMTSWGGYHNGFTRRDAQSIWYASPSIGGATIEAAYITPAGRKTDNLSPFGLQFGASWKSGFGLSLHGAFAQYNDEGGDNKNRAMRIGAGFGTEMFQVDVFGEQLKFTDSSISDKRVNIGVSGSVNIGQHHIRAALSNGGKVKRNGSSIDDSSGRLFYVGYAYTLSKRTELSVIYGKVDNKRNSAFGTADVNDFTDGGFGHDADRFGVGIRHTF